MQGQYEVDLVAVAFIGRPCQRVRDTSALKENQTKQNKTQLPFRICSFDSFLLIEINISLVTTDKILFRLLNELKTQEIKI